MGRYIDADKMKSIKSIQSASFNSIESIREWIDAQPTADVRENIKAQKVIGGGEHDGATCWFECSRCGKTVDVNDKYCSECGARFEE